MDINKIIHFETRNKLRISVFGIEGMFFVSARTNKRHHRHKTYEIVPLYVSSNRTNTEYPSIQLLYYKPEGIDYIRRW